MRAAWYDRLGPAAEVIQFGEQPDPVAGPGQVLLRVHASGINPADVKRRSGPPSMAAMEFPRIIPNSDGAGVVEAVGEGVDAGWIGRRAWLFNGQRFRAFGTAAELIAIEAWKLSPLPDDVSMAEGACLGIPCMTAHRAVFAAGPVAGKRVLVTGGAGAVGHYAVQWAKWGGAAQVLATASSPAKAAAAQAAGADRVIDYRREDVAEAVMAETGRAGVDHIAEVDLAGNLAASMGCLASGATIATYASTGKLDLTAHLANLGRQNVAIRWIILNTIPRADMAQAQRDITAWLATRYARHRVAARFPLDRIVAAHEAVEAGDKLGTVVVQVTPGG